MTKDELVEAMAEIGYGQEFTGPPFDQIGETMQEFYRERVREFWPLIVRFVEDWIERDGNFDDEAVERASRWYRDVSGEAQTT